MNKPLFIIAPLLLGLSMLTAWAQQPPSDVPHQGCPMHQMVPAVEFHSTSMCYSPQHRAFVAIDSVECSVHLVGQVSDHLDTVATFQTDNIHKRHDLKSILRPVSVGTLGPYIAVLASAKTDSSYLVFLDERMHPVARRGFSCPMYAMHFEHGQVMLAGQNPYGYDIQVLPLHGGFEAFEHGQALVQHYRVPKQSEKIQHSDPVGIGLSAVAVAVVFLALICICLILSGSGKLIGGIEDRRKKKDAPSPKPAPGKKPTPSNADAELIAAISAAIHLYNEELHDEENTVITIQKVEREWTPWNAKYYNMNHYFTTRR